ncbi:MAG: hypothetical protein Q4E13_10435 [Clostridia bacterium]|nr:hypothetical protein [Clostridia bacterium]
MNPREVLNQSAENDHMLVPPIVELRDSIGSLAVQALAARENLAALTYPEMLDKLYAIICELHTAYDRNRTNLK